MLAVATTPPLAGRDAVSLAEVADEPFVVRGALGHAHPDPRALRRGGFEPEVAFEADDLPTVRGLAAAGLGVAVVPAMGLPAPRPSPAPACYPHGRRRTAREVGLAWVAGRPLLPRPRRSAASSSPGAPPTLRGG